MDFFDKFLEEINIEKENETACLTPYKFSSKIEKKVQSALIDIDNNRNHSWAMEMYEQNKDRMNNIALFYRGTKVSYKEMFEKSFIYARSLKKMGFCKYDEIPICMANTPEFVYLFIAISFIGAKANIVGEWFNENYLTEILNKTGSKTMFIDDISYDSIKTSINNSKIENLVCFSLADSFLKDKSNKICNPYEIIDSKFHVISNKTKYIKNTFNGNILNK